METATSFARHLATYIKDPSTIRARCAENFSRVPSLESIKRMQAQANRPRKAMDVGEPTDADADDFRVRGLVRPKRRTVDVMAWNPPEFVQCWPKWYTPPERKQFNLLTITEALVASVAKYHGFTIAEVRGDNRAKAMVDARRVVASVLRARGWSYPRIGHVLGKRDHSTSINLCRSIEWRVKQSRFVEQSLEYHMAVFGPKVAA